LKRGTHTLSTQQAADYNDDDKLLFLFQKKLVKKVKKQRQNK